MSATYRTSIEIAAEPERVFDYFIRPELLVRWMGDRARLEARDGGLFAVDINGVIRALKEIGYNGWYSWEDEPEDRNPFDSAVRNREYIEARL